MHQTITIRLPIHFPKILAQIPFPGAFPKIMKIQKLGKWVGVIELRNPLNNSPDPACGFLRASGSSYVKLPLWTKYPSILDKL